MQRYRIAIVNDSTVKPCVFDPIPCPRPGFTADFTLRVLELIVPNNNHSSSFFPAEGYGYTGDLSYEGNKETILGKIRDGLADISAADFSMTNSRRAIFDPIGPYVPFEFVFMFRPPDEVPKVDIAHFPLKLYALLILISISYRLISHLLTKYCPQHIKDYVYGAIMNNKLILLLFYGIFLKCVSGDLVIFFNKMIPKQTFDSTIDILEGLESGDFKAVVVYEYVIDNFLNPIDYKGEGEFFDRMIRATERNPPIKLGDFKSAVDLVLDEFTDNQHFLAVSTEDVPHVLSRYCGLSFLRDEYFPKKWHSIFHNASRLSLKSVNQVSSTIIQAEWDRTMELYNPILACNREAMLNIPNRSQYPLRFFQLQTVFYGYLGVLALTFSVLIAEILVSQTKK